LYIDKDAGNYVCRAINIVYVATANFFVTVSYECGVYDELGNIISIDENCGGDGGPDGNQNSLTGSSFLIISSKILLFLILLF